VGDRQLNREIGKNVMLSDYSIKTIKSSIKKQLDHGKYPQSTRYGDGNAGKNIANIIPTIKPSKNKTYKI